MGRGLAAHAALRALSDDSDQAAPCGPALLSCGHRINVSWLRAKVDDRRQTGRVGPVIASEHEALPYTFTGRSQAFRRLRNRLKLRPEITMMDTRAGALTEGGRAGADLLVLQDAAGHLDASTTNRYVRSREANVVRLVKLRNDS